MKHPDYDRAFHETPDYIRSAIELGFMKGKRRMQIRRRFAGAMTAAAVFVALLCAGAYGVLRLTAPRPDRYLPSTPLSVGNPSSAAPEQPAPTPTASITPTPSVTPTPKATPTLKPEASPTPAPTAPGFAPEAALSQAVEVTPEPTGEIPTPGIDPTPAPTPESDLATGPEAELVYLSVRVDEGENPCFHLDERCGGAELPEWLNLATALWEGLAPCPDCVEGRGYRLLVFRADEAGEVAVRDGLWYTQSGNYLHVDSTCSGMANAQKRGIAEALNSGKRTCPVCMANWACALALDVPEAERALAEGLWEYVHGSGSTDDEPAGEAASVEIATAAEASGEVYFADGGRYFHGNPDCARLTLEQGQFFPPELSGPGSAIESSPQVAIRSGREPCPDCLPDWELTEWSAAAAAEEPVEIMTEADVAPEAEAEEVMSDVEVAPEAEGEELVSDVDVVPASEGEELVSEVDAAPEAEAEEVAPARGEGNVSIAVSKADSAIAISTSDGAPYDISHRFYYTPNGKYYHMRSDCSGMIGATRHSAAEAAASGKKHCPVCIGEKRSYYWLPEPREDGNYDTPTLYFAEWDAWIPSVWSDAGNVFVPLNPDGEQPNYYHANPECFGMSGAQMLPWDDAKKEGRIACPACLPGLNQAGSRERCYVSENDKLYHSVRDCPEVANPRESTEIEAQAEGRLRCPSCAQGANCAPAGWTEIRSELGASIASAYPGWNFERADEFEDRIEYFASDGTQSMRAAIFRFAEADEAKDENSLLELTLEHGDSATRYFAQSFIESLPTPLNAIQLAAAPDQIFTLRLEYEGSNLTGFTIGETKGRETSYTTWIIHPNGTATTVPLN